MGRKKLDFIERVKTHITGFDGLIEGGFPVGSNILVNGSPGVGKTIFSLQFVYNSLIKDKEKVLYFTFEEKKESLISQGLMFGWNFNEFEKKRRLKIISLGKDIIKKSEIKDIIDIIKDNNATRVVFDSLTTLTYLIHHERSSWGSTEAVIENFLFDLISSFHELEGVCTLFISQEDKVLINKTSEYLCDGIVNIQYQNISKVMQYSSYSKLCNI